MGHETTVSMGGGKSEELVGKPLGSLSTIFSLASSDLGFLGVSYFWKCPTENGRPEVYRIPPQHVILMTKCPGYPEGLFKVVHPVKKGFIKISANEVYCVEANRSPGEVCRDWQGPLELFFSGCFPAIPKPQPVREYGLPLNAVALNDAVDREQPIKRMALLRVPIDLIPTLLAGWRTDADGFVRVMLATDEPGAVPADCRVGAVSADAGFQQGELWFRLSGSMEFKETGPGQHAHEVQPKLIEAKVARRHLDMAASGRLEAIGKRLAVLSQEQNSQELAEMGLSLIAGFEDHHIAERCLSNRVPLRAWKKEQEGELPTGVEFISDPGLKMDFTEFSHVGPSPLVGVRRMAEMMDAVEKAQLNRFAAAGMKAEAELLGPDADVEKYVVEKVKEKLQAVVNEEDREEEQRIMEGDPDAQKPGGVLNICSNGSCKGLVGHVVGDSCCSFSARHHLDVLNERKCTCGPDDHFFSERCDFCQIDLWNKGCMRWEQMREKPLIPAGLPEGAEPRGVMRGKRQEDQDLFRGLIGMGLAKEIDGVVWVCPTGLAKEEPSPESKVKFREFL